MTDARDKQDLADMVALVKQEAFVRFLWRVTQLSGIFSHATDGSQDRHLAYAEGRRNLGLDILAMVETGQPVSHPEAPVLTMLQLLREEANRQPQEKQLAKRYDRSAELDDAED